MDALASATDGQAVETCIALSHASYVLDGKTILSDISLSLAARRIGIVGRNGSGKSTLARLLAGLIAPTSGQVALNGTDVAGDRKAALREVGILFQNPDHQIIFPTVIEELAFGLQQQGMTETAAESAALATLERFGKAHWREAHVHALSQGQKHLVCLMAVAAMAPRILILDEPFAGMDIPTRNQLARYLDLYDGALVHISHDPADLAGCDAFVWLDRGAIRAHGPREAVVPAFLDEMNRLGESDDISDIAG